jgi:hypothetical protein
LLNTNTSLSMAFQSFRLVKGLRTNYDFCNVCFNYLF